jgi:hypothetical protein
MKDSYYEITDPTVATPEDRQKLLAELWFQPSDRLTAWLANPKRTWVDIDVAIQRLRTSEEDTEFGARHWRRIENTHDGWGNARDKVFSLAGKGVTIALLGPRGSGKTQLGAYAARRIVEGDIHNTNRPLYVTFAEIVRRIRATFAGGSSSSEANVMWRLVRVPLLVIDELHEAKMSDFEASRLTAIVDERYRKLLNTVLISNQDATTFMDAVGPSVADRMREGGGVIEMDWPSLRGTCATPATNRDITKRVGRIPLNPPPRCNAI